MNQVARAELLALCEGAGDCPWVFVNPTTGVSIGDIKKAFVSALADRGVPLSVIRDLLGQKTLKMARW